MNSSCTGVLYLLIASVLFVVSLCENQGNAYIWGNEFQYFTAPVLSFPEFTWSDIFQSESIVAKHTNGTLYFLLTSGMSKAPYTDTNTKEICTRQLNLQSTYVVVTNEGDLYAWGYLIGDGSTTTHSTPVQLQGELQGKVVTQCTATAVSISVMTSDNKIFSWGIGTQGQVRDNR